MASCSLKMWYHSICRCTSQWMEGWYLEITDNVIFLFHISSRPQARVLTSTCSNHSKLHRLNVKVADENREISRANWFQALCHEVWQSVFRSIGQYKSPLQRLEVSFYIRVEVSWASRGHYDAEGCIVFVPTASTCCSSSIKTCCWAAQRQGLWEAEIEAVSLWWEQEIVTRAS